MLEKFPIVATVLLLSACSTFQPARTQSALIAPIEVDIELLPPTASSKEPTWIFSSTQSPPPLTKCTVLGSDQTSTCGDIGAGPIGQAAQFEFTLHSAEIGKYCARLLNDNVQVLFGKKGLFSSEQGIVIQNDANNEFHNANLSKEVSTFTIADENRIAGPHKYTLVIYCVGKKGSMRFAHDPKIKNGGGTGCGVLSPTCN